MHTFEWFSALPGGFMVSTPRGLQSPSQGPPSPNGCILQNTVPTLASIRLHPILALGTLHPTSLWLSLQLEYTGASAVQLRFLRLHSHRAAQKISYSCRPAPHYRQPQKEIRFLADTREQSYVATLQGCLVSGTGTWQHPQHCKPRAQD